jgi:hypothetical protein
LKNTFLNRKKIPDNSAKEEKTTKFFTMNVDDLLSDWGIQKPFPLSEPEKPKPKPKKIKKEVEPFVVENKAEQPPYFETPRLEYKEAKFEITPPEVAPLEFNQTFETEDIQSPMTEEERQFEELLINEEEQFLEEELPVEKLNQDFKEEATLSLELPKKIAKIEK